MTIEEAFRRLGLSKFRSRFKLNDEMKAYVAEKGMEVIRLHAIDFVRIKLSPAHPANDGKQTPMRGHPIFIAQHATATCCRGCLNKWWKVPMGVVLTPEQQAKIVNFIMAWVEKQVNET